MTADEAENPGFSQKSRGFSRLLAASFQSQAGLIAVVILFLISGAWVGSGLDVSVWHAIGGYVPTYLRVVALALALLLAGYAAWIMVALRPKRPLTVFVQHLRERLIVRERLTLALPVLLLIPVFAGTFTMFKSVIPVLNPYSWDPTFAAWDEWLHFGYAPWRLMQPLLGHPLVTWTVNFFYNLWFFVLAVMWVWQAFSLRDPRLRLQFFYTLILSWILLGSLMAVVFASVGPCFYGRLVEGPDPFAPLLTYLQAADLQHDIWALSAQELLWNSYVSGEIRLGTGISAMPSMHVAMTFLFVLVGYRTARWLGRLCLAYMLLILIGSVHLGWHYLIDGYASIVLVLPIWWLAGWLAARGSNMAAPDR